jgi:Tfp pilus assembly PilM family ATPase
MWPLGSKKVAVGVDIGSSSFRVARLTAPRGKGKPQLTLVGSIAVPRGAIVGGEIVDLDVVAQSLSELWKKTGLKEKEIIFGVSNQRVVVRLIDFPYMDANELRSAIQFQAQDFIPLPIEDVILDFQVINDYYTESGERMLRILLVAAQKGMVETFIAAAEKAGLKPTIVDVNAFAVARALAGTGSSERTELRPVAEESEPGEGYSQPDTPAVEVGESGAPGGQEPEASSIEEAPGATSGFPEASPSEEAQQAAPAWQPEAPTMPASEPYVEPPSAVSHEPQSSEPEMGFETISSDEFAPQADEEPVGENEPDRKGPDLATDGAGLDERVSADERPAVTVTAIVDIGAEITNLIILEDGSPRFVRAIGVGGESWTEAIVEQLGYAFDEAEELKTKIGLPPLSGDRYLDIPGDMLDKADAVFSVLEREIVRFIGEVRRSFEYYISQGGGSEVREMIISGGASNLRRLAAYLERGLGVQVRRGNPLEKVDVSPRVADQIPAGEAGSYAIAIGLALRGVE